MRIANPLRRQAIARRWIFGNGAAGMVDTESLLALGPLFLVGESSKVQKGL
jgi:hypothetical protein